MALDDVVSLRVWKVFKTGKWKTVKLGPDDALDEALVPEFLAIAGEVDRG